MSNTHRQIKAKQLAIKKKKTQHHNSSQTFHTTYIMAPVVSLWLLF